MRSSSKFFINPDYQNLEAFIKSVPALFDLEGEILYNKRNVVRRYQVDGVDLTVKRYRHPLPFQRFDYTFFRPSKAKRAYLFALRLEKLQIETPTAIACIEVYRSGLFYDGYFVSLYTSEPDCRILREEPMDCKLADALAAYLVECHEKGFMHGDLNLSNIMYHVDEDGLYHFSVIDINRSKFIQNPSRSMCMDNLKRLSHQRDLLMYLVGRYAEIRGWDAQLCQREVVSRLEKFERKRNFLRTLKGKK